MAIHHQLELWGNVTSPPIQTVTFGPSNFSFEMLRLDLMKGWASGNKYYKLKIPLYHFISQQVKHVVSKGGMFSNHLVALAEACHAFDISLNCIVRSYEPDEENPTIRYLKSLNADIQYFSPGEYLNFDEDKSQQLFPDAYFIPEGGLSTDGILGVGDLVNEFNAQHYDHIVLAAGTMCTACGIISRLSSNAQVHIVPAWKGCTSDYVEKIFDKYELPRKANWDIWPDYHFGGFGKFNEELIQSEIR